MQETLNSRIRKLRKEKGLTQLQLAELLNITDKAVSKWELGEGNPDIGLLPMISQIFGVTVDYILTGNMTNNIVLLEDMDNAKRAVYLVQKDDLENFIRFEYNKVNPLISPYKNTLQLNVGLTQLQSQIREEIYKNQSTKIFNYLLDDLISSKKYIQYVNRSNGPKIAASLVYNDIDDYIKMCAINGRIDGLKFISFDRLAIGEKDKQTFYTNNYQVDLMQTYLILESTLHYIFEDSRVSEEIVKYVATVRFFEKQSGSRTREFYFLNDYILFCVYHYKKLNLLKDVYNKLNDYLDKAIAMYPNIVGNHYGRDRVVFKHQFANSIYFTIGNSSTGNNRDQNVTHIIEPISKAFDEAIDKLDIEWIELFNDYNKKIANYLSDSQSYLDEKTIEMLRMKSNPEIADEEVLVFNFTKASLLDVEGLLKSIITDVTDVKSLNTSLKHAKDLYNRYISTSYIHYCEMIEDLLSKKDYKKLFQFSVDHDLSDLTDVLLNRKYDSIMKVARQLFYLDSEAKNNSLNASRIRRAKNQTDELINILLRLNPTHRKNDKYINILRNQYNCCDIDNNNIESFVEVCSITKKEVFDNFISDINNKIEKLTGEKKAKEEFEKVNEEINEDYLNSLISDNQLETLVIKLCVKLEAKLKYTYKYEGEFKVMLDSYINNNLKLENLWDDEDNNYYTSKQNDAKKQEITKLLNKLRIVRNGIVHSTSQKESLNKLELEQIVKVIEKI